MGELRKQLETEKETYRAARYDGDLAADVLGRGRGNWWIGAMGAVAAAVVIAVNLYTRPADVVAPTAKRKVVLATNTAKPEESLWTPPRVQAVSMSDVGDAPSLGAMPSFPSMAEAAPGANAQ